MDISTDRPKGVLWAWLLSAAALAASFAYTFKEMFHRWFPAWRNARLSLYDRFVEGESYYTHGPLILLVSALIVLLLLRYTRVPVRPVRGAGWAVLIASMLVHLAASLARVTFLSGFAFIGVLAGLVLLLWGWAALRRLWFPLAILLFMVPLPEVAIADLNFRLKMIAADWGVRLAELTGLVVVRSGARVFLEDDKTLVVANVCNGLRTLISLLAFGAIYAYVCRLKGLWRVALFAMSVPVAVAANTVRIASLILVAAIADVETATGWYHDFSGLMIFVIAFVLMFGLERAVLLIRKAVGRPAVQTPLFHGAGRTDQDAGQGARLVRAAVPAGWFAAVALGLSAGGAIWLSRARPSRPDLRMAGAALPKDLDADGRSWRGYDMRLDDRTLTILETRDYVFRRYVSADAAPVDYCVIFSADNRKGTHPPDLCIEGSGQEIIAKGDVAVDGVDGRGRISARELIVQSDRGREYYLYTYRCGGEYTGSFLRQQLVIFVNGLTNRNSGGALVRISLVVEDDVAHARRKAQEFLRLTVPELDKVLP